MKRTIRTNRWGNTSAFLGTRKVYEFGLDEMSAREWLETGSWLTSAGGQTCPLKSLLASVDIDGTVSFRPYEKGWYGGRYETAPVTDTPAGR